MSARPIEQKRRRRVAKQVKRRPLPAFFDLVDWLVSHGHAKTKREAREVILAGRVKANSHTLGVLKDQMVAVPGFLGSVKIEKKDVVNPRVPVEHRKDIIVSGAAA